MGASFSAVLNVNKEKVDIAAIVSKLESEKTPGKFLEVEDFEGNKRVSFALE